MRIAKHKTLIKILENSIVSPTYIFQNLYMTGGNETKDILEDGAFSCAIFVSWVLLPLGLIKSAHATVPSTVKDLLESGWQETVELQPGAVLLWEKKMGDDDGKLHDHIGFYMGNNEAISNNSRGTGKGERIPWRHHATYEDTRKIEKIFWHPDLND